MQQLGQLQKQAEEISKQNAEVIIVLREDKNEARSLAKIKERFKTDFTLLSDLGTKTTGPYSAGRGSFNTYVIDQNGVIQEVIDGTLRKRATSELVLEALKKINAE